MIYTRIYNSGPMQPDQIEKMRASQIAPIHSLAIDLIGRGLRDRITILTNDWLDPKALALLTASRLDLVVTSGSTWAKRQWLGKKLIKKTSSQSNGISNADMLNSVPKYDDWYLFMSSDFANTDREAVVNILQSLKTLSKESLFNAASVGIMTPANHDRGEIQKVLDGEWEISLSNISRMFPNNSFAFYPRYAKFSGITDNGLAGTIEINGKQEPIGGNEDFYYWLSEMLHWKNVYMLIEPTLPGEERVWEVSSVWAKYARRQAVYRAYARRLISKQEKDKDISDNRVDDIFEKLVDEHFFFLSITQDGKPEIVLTERQKKKRVAGPSL